MGFEQFKEHSVAEFFKKNKQMLGFSGKVKSLTTIVHEYMTNSLDAAEENGILPSVKLEIKEVEKGERYIVIVEDNAGGIPKTVIGKALGKILAGTKFHRQMQQRGQQGIGAAGCTLYSYITTGKHVKFVSGYQGTVIEGEVFIDVNRNEPKVIVHSEQPGEFSGLRVIAEFAEVKFENSQYGVMEYIKRTALANPCVEITFVPPEGERMFFPRSSDLLPQRPKEIQPHPMGLTAHDIFEMMKKDSEHRTIESTLIDTLSRVTKQKTQELQEQIQEVDISKKPTEITWDDATTIVSGIKKVKWMAPSLESVIPVGEQQLEKAILSILDPQYYAVTQRKPSVYSGGIPFVVEVVLAYGGQSGANNSKGETMRFANRVPLLFDAGGCAVTEAVKSIEWKRYGIKSFDEEPITLIVNISSVFIPYTSAGKQTISPEEDIVNEIRFAVMETARKLNRFLSGKRRDQEIAGKKKALIRYVEQLAADVAELSGHGKPDELKKQLLELIEQRYLSGAADENGEEGSENGGEETEEEPLNGEEDEKEE